MKFIFLGDVVGEPGRDTVRAAIPILRERYKPDFFVVNGEVGLSGAQEASAFLAAFEQIFERYGARRWSIVKEKAHCLP